MLTVNRAVLPAVKEPSTLRQSSQTAGSNPKGDQVTSAVFGTNDGLARRTSDGDVDMEDIPMGAYHNALWLQSEDL